MSKKKLVRGNVVPADTRTNFAAKGGVAVGKGLVGGRRGIAAFVPKVGE